jgi:hypothetical protein
MADGDGRLCAARLTTELALNAFAPALAVTTRGRIPPAEGGTVMTTLVCDPNDWAAAKTKALETAAPLPAAATLPRPAFARLLRTETWESLVLKPTTWARTPDADREVRV